jgi:CubicO group peptidase (beta-lactamase class C family)
MNEPVPTKRRWPRGLAIAVGVVFALVLASFAYTAAIGMNNPAFIARYLLTPSSEVGDLFAYRVIPPSERPRPIPEELSSLPAEVPWKGSMTSTEEVLTQTKTNALMVVCEGQVTQEWYRDPAEATSRQSSWSVAKSVVSLLVGQLIGEGKLTEDTLLVDVLPEYANGTAFDSITVGQLLDMSSGIDVTEDYSYLKPFSGVGGMQVTTDLPDYLMQNRGLVFEPGSTSQYRSVDAQYLSMIVAKVTGKPLAQVVYEQLWQPIGAQDQATWNLDSEGGIEKGFSALNATPRDFAKIGLLVVNDGKVGDQQVVPKAWIERIATPAVEALPGWRYSALWWHPPGFAENGDYSAIGVYGQYVYVNPEHDAVVVKLSDYGAEQDEAETIDVFRSLVQGCGGE